jgi:hypothetical protein
MWVLKIGGVAFGIFVALLIAESLFWSMTHKNTEALGLAAGSGMLLEQGLYIGMVGAWFVIFKYCNSHPSASQNLTRQPEPQDLVPAHRPLQRAGIGLTRPVCGPISSETLVVLSDLPVDFDRLGDEQGRVFH